MNAMETINNIFGNNDSSNFNLHEDERPTIGDTLAMQRTGWTKEIEQMNEDMKNLQKLDEMQNRIYTKRQDAVDYYYSMNQVILNQTKEYRKLYNDMFNNIKINGYNGIRFTSDQQITRQIETALEDRKEIIDLLTNQNAFIKDTISTIDNMIYGITQKVKIKELLNGLKF